MTDFTSTRTLALLIAAALTIALVVAALLGGTRGTSPDPGAVGSSGQGTDSLRTLLVATSEPEPSAPGEPMRGRLVEGELPAEPTTATVLTDTNCEPDATGLSRCKNRLRLAGGEEIAVRHPHRMMEVPCMTPGERVQLEGA